LDVIKFQVPTAGLTHEVHGRKVAMKLTDWPTSELVNRAKAP